MASRAVSDKTSKKLGTRPPSPWSRAAPPKAADQGKARPMHYHSSWRTRSSATSSGLHQEHLHPCPARLPSAGGRAQCSGELRGEALGTGSGTAVQPRPAAVQQPGTADAACLPGRQHHLPATMPHCLVHVTHTVLLALLTAGVKYATDLAGWFGSGDGVARCVRYRGWAEADLRRLCMPGRRHADLRSRPSPTYPHQGSPRHPLRPGRWLGCRRLGGPWSHPRPWPRLALVNLSRAAVPSAWPS